MARLVIWDVIALIMTPLWWFMFSYAHMRLSTWMSPLRYWPISISQSNNRRHSSVCILYTYIHTFISECTWHCPALNVGVYYIYRPFEWLQPHGYRNLHIQYIPRNMHTVFALLCFVVVIHWLIFPYSSGLLHWHCGNLTIALVPAKQPWWIWINTSCEFIMNDCVTTTKRSTTKPCAYFLGYTVSLLQMKSGYYFGISCIC